jgi:hypothetical protein
MGHIKKYVIYFMHIDFIQSSSSNHWIKLSFEFQNVVMHILKIFFLCLGFSEDAIRISAYCMLIIFVIHHFFKVKSGSPVLCFHL